MSNDGVPEEGNGEEAEQVSLLNEERFDGYQRGASNFRNAARQGPGLGGAASLNRLLEAATDSFVAQNKYE